MLAKSPSIRVAPVRTRNQVASDQPSLTTGEQVSVIMDDYLGQVADDQIAGKLPDELQEWSQAVMDDKEYQDIRIHW